MRKPVFTFSAMIILCCLFLFIFRLLFSQADPFRIYPGSGILTAETEETITGYEEVFAVKRGFIADTITFDETVPTGSYEIRNLELSSSEGRITAGPGDYISPGRAVWQFKNGSILSFPSAIRILCVNKPSQDQIRIRYLSSPDILLEVKLPELYLNKINSGTRIHAWIGGQETKASLISTGDNVTEGIFSIILSLDDQGLLGRPGSRVTVQITAEEKQDVLLIPSECVFLNNAGETCVLLKKEDSTVEISVDTGINDGRMTEITSGLSEGDLVLSLL